MLPNVKQALHSSKLVVHYVFFLWDVKKARLRTVKAVAWNYHKKFSATVQQLAFEKQSVIN